MSRTILSAMGGLAALGTIAAGAVTADLPAEAFGILKSRCVRCHGPARREGGLDLAVPQGLLRGGQSGPALARGKPDRSRLWRRVAAGEMPPGEPLPASEKRTLRQWIASGAPGVPLRVAPRPEGDEHWAFQPLAPAAPPPVRDVARVRTPIDRFVEARLETRGLTLGPEADPETLIRRVTFDLTGLPPTPEEVEAFLRECAAERASGLGRWALGSTPGDGAAQAASGSGGSRAARIPRRQSFLGAAPAAPPPGRTLPARYPAGPRKPSSDVGSSLPPVPRNTPPHPYTPRSGERRMSNEGPASGSTLDARQSHSPRHPAPNAQRPTPDAYERLIERLLNDPRYGERWGKYWLDAAGYADSNGYFNADTDRPLAYRYRDYVVRSLNADKPWDQFIREQLAGDELAGYKPGGEVTPRMVELLEATHFLRNSQDGTDSSDGNPDERRADKYAVLEGTEQIIGSSLLGLTVQCARCHDHKFEPFSQRDYYQLQAVLYPAFNIDMWVVPKQREIVAATAAETAAREAETKQVEAQIAAKRRAFAEWTRRNREPGRVLFEDGFDQPGQRLASLWSNTAPGDPVPAGQPPVLLDSPAAPGAQIVGGALRIHESGSPGDRALSTRQAFAWTPPEKGAWILATYDLVAGADTAPYVGFFLALRDFSGTAGSPGGNVLIDGAAAGQATVYVGYPARSQGRGKIGKSGYAPGHNYGVRVTNLGSGRFELAQLVDGLPETGSVELSAAALPSGGFGFEYCCGRSFRVDNVLLEVGGSMEPDPARRAAAQTYARQRAAFVEEIKALEARRPEKPGRIAVVTDLSPEPPAVPLLERGEYRNPKGNVAAAAPGVLSERGNPADLAARAPEVRHTTGRRLAFARWLTQPGSRAAALLARVTVNRWWQHHFGSGIVATPENLGYSGALPTHPELLEYLAGRLVRSGWSARALHREILLSAVYRQSSHHRPRSAHSGSTGPADARLLSHFPLRRLDAEALRDGMLAVSGELDLRMGGPYVPTTREGQGDVVVPEGTAGAVRRSLYLQQRRTQVTGLLEVFDAPSIVFNCTARSSTTVPLQALKLLNSGFVRARAAALARRLLRECPDDSRARLRRAWALAWARRPGERDESAAREFLAAQAAEYPGQPNAEELAWTDFCQMLLASNRFLYVE